MKKEYEAHQKQHESNQKAEAHAENLEKDSETRSQSVAIYSNFKQGFHPKVSNYIY